MRRRTILRLAPVLLVAGLVGFQQAEAGPPDGVAIGAAAPDFTLPDTEGGEVTLSGLLDGKTVVVLEWFNPGCPYVVKHHERNDTMVETAARFAGDGVVWLAINSGAPGRQGHGVETNRAIREKWRIPYPILLDEAGRVGRAYGATRTPHMVVIGRGGEVIYQGAIDNDPGRGVGDLNYVARAIEAHLAGRPVEPAETPAYG